MTITERLFKTLADKKLSQKELGLFINTSDKTISAWKSNNSLPPADKLVGISQFLGVTLEYLVTGEETNIPRSMTETELKMLNLFSELTPIQQGELIGRAAIMSEQNESEAVRKGKAS